MSITYTGAYGMKKKENVRLSYNNESLAKRQIGRPKTAETIVYIYITNYNNNEEDRILYPSPCSTLLAGGHKSPLLRDH